MYLGQEPIGCFRIFDIEKYENTIELGSLVVNPEHWGNGYSECAIEHAEYYAESIRKSLILITDNEGLKNKIQKRSWSEASQQFRERIEKSPGKQLYKLEGRTKLIKLAK